MNASSIKKIDFQSPTAAKEFHDCIKEIGFAVFYNYPLDNRLIQKVFAEWKAFFSSVYKYNYTRKEQDRFGYFPCDISETPLGAVEKDFKEFYHLNETEAYPLEITENTRNLFKEIIKVASELLSWLENGLPPYIKNALSESLVDMIKGGTNMMRVVHYPPIMDKSSQALMRAAQHVDINFITILLASSEPGLQAQDHKGNWHDIPVNENIISINTGSPLQEATQGYYPATMHRVITPQDQLSLPRYSIPTFLHARADAKLSEKYTAKSHLNEHLAILHQENFE